MRQSNTSPRRAGAARSGARPTPASAHRGETEQILPVAGSTPALQGAILALIRIAVGFFWYQESLLKLPGHTAYFKQLLAMVAKHAIIPGYGGVVRALFVPHATLFALCVYLLESAIALSLLFGVLTRLGGVAGAVWGALLFCGLAYGAGPGSNPWYFGLIVLVNALLALTAAGRSLGVDRWLRPRMLRRAREGRPWARYVALAE